MDEIKKIRERLTKLHDAKRSGSIYAMRDIADWMDFDLTEVGHLLDELEMSLESEKEIKQLEFNYEVKKEIERSVVA